MRGVAKDGRPRNFANDHRGVGQWTGVWKSQWAHVPGPQGFLRCVEETHMKKRLFFNRLNVEKQSIAGPLHARPFSVHLTFLSCRLPCPPAEWALRGS